MFNLARITRRAAVGLALLVSASSSFAQQFPTMDEIVVTPLYSPSGLGPMFMSHFFSQVSIVYPSSFQANKIMCDAAKSRAQTRGCARPGENVDLEDYLETRVFNSTLLGGINPVYFDDMMRVYAFTLVGQGIAAADTQLRSNITSQCAARYDGPLESTCANEAFGRINRSWGEGGLAGITSTDVESVSRGLDCTEIALDAVEFCGVQH